MTTFPPAPLTYQNNQLLAFRDSQISYVGYEGTIFHLRGPLAPVLGAQSGAAIVAIQGLDAPFRHLDNKGSRQDGTTWYDTLYEPAEIGMQIELSGISPSDTRNTVRSWWGAWDTKQTGKLCWFSPERGEWWCNVRMGKNLSNAFKDDWYQGGKVSYNWVARNDAAFWQGVDSVSVYGHDSNGVSDIFDRQDYGSLQSNWKQTYTGAGLCATPASGVCSWIANGNANGSVINQYSGAGSNSANSHSGNDHQMISVILQSDMPLPVTGTVVSITATGGSFTLSYGGQTTSALNYSSGWPSTAAVKTALEGITNIGTGNVTVSGTPANYTVTLSSSVPVAGSLKINTGSLTGGSGSVSPATGGASRSWSANANGSQWRYSVNNVTGGNYTLKWGSFTTANIAWNASSSSVQSLLATAIGTSTSNITVTSSFTASAVGGIYTYSYTVQFANSLGYQDLTATNVNLTGLFLSISTPLPQLNGTFSSDFPATAQPSTYSWYANATGLGVSGGGWKVTSSGATFINSSGGENIVNIYQSPSLTDSQTVSVTTSGSINTDTGGPLLSLAGRSDIKGSNYVFANIYQDKVEIGVVRSGFPNVLATESWTSAAGSWTLLLDGINYVLCYNGSIVMQAFDNAGVARVGANYRYAGFGAYCPIIGAGSLGAYVTAWSVTDNTAHTFIDLWGRMDTALTGLDGIRARFGYNWGSLAVLNNGTLTQVWAGPTNKTLVAGDTLSLQCGVTEPGVIGSLEKFFTGDNRNSNQFQMYVNGAPIIIPQVSAGNWWQRIIAGIDNFFGIGFGWFDFSGISKVGTAYRGWGFGMSAAGAPSGTQIGPANIDSWSGGSDSGFIQLSNAGDQPGWPRYLCYGPGTFVIGDGASGNTVTFGPLLPGQVALLTTLPRIQSVIDVTPAIAAAGSPVPTPSNPLQQFADGLTQLVQGLVSGLVNFVSVNNVPPLLQQFESLFGILPPQSALYSLLSGRFSTPIPAMQEQSGLTTVQIPVQIQGGNNSSKVIAAVTPLRRWPE